MSDGRGRRVALGAAIAFWVAVVVAREWRRALPAWVEAPEQPLSPAPPVPAPPEPPAREPVAETWVAPPPVAAPVVPAPRAPIPSRASPPPAAKPARKSRRKILVLLGVVLLLGALAGASLGLRSNTSGLTSFQGETGSPTATTTGSSSTRFGPFCVTQRAGWKSQWVVSDNSGTPPALVMTNFKFGAAPAAWGLFDPSLHWTARDLMIAVADWTTTAKGSVRDGFPPGSLRIGHSDVTSFGPAHIQVGHKQVRFHGRLLALFVEARPQSAAALTAANSLLSGVRICSP